MFEIFNILFTNPLTNLLVVFYKLFITLHIPYSLGFAIIALTVFIKLVLYPLMSAQIRSSQKMQTLAPKLSEIKEKYKDDKQRQQSEIMKLYQTEGINPAAGCLPLLVQFPILISLYHVLTSIVSENSQEAINKVNDVVYFPFLNVETAWSTNFFGIPLHASPSDLLGTLPMVLMVPIITGFLQFILSKMMIPEAVPNAKKKVQKKDDFQTAFQKQSLFIFPIMIAYFSFTLPFGLSLYWNTFTIFGILQQYLLVGPGSMKPWFARIGIYGRNT